MIDLSQEYDICRHDDGLDDMQTDHGDSCEYLVEEDGEGNKLEESLCDRDDKPCKVGKVKFGWIGDPLPSEE